MRERSAKEIAIFQLLVGLIAGGILVWLGDRYGWISVPAVWGALGLLFLVVAFSFWEIRTRLDRIEKRYGDGR